MSNVFYINFNKPIQTVKKVTKNGIKQEKSITLVKKKVYNNSQFKTDNPSISQTQPMGFSIKPKISINPQTKVVNFEVPPNMPVIKAVHLNPSTNPNVIKIEQAMKELGVKVTFEDDLETAKLFLKLTKKVKEKGLDMPSSITLFTPTVPMVHGHTSVFPKLKVYFSKDLVANAKRGFLHIQIPEGICTIKTPTAEHTFYHEIAHYNHLKICPDNKTSAKIFQDFINQYGIQNVIKEVSEGAIKEPTGKELVADVMAGLLRGKRFSKAIMDVYAALNGPKFST